MDQGPADTPLIEDESVDSSEVVDGPADSDDPDSQDEGPNDLAEVGDDGSHSELETDAPEDLDSRVDTDDAVDLDGLDLDELGDADLDADSFTDEEMDVDLAPDLPSGNVPNVVGLTETEARSVISEAGFSAIETRTTYSDDAEVDIVVMQLPLARTTVAADTAFLLTVSVGSAADAIPPDPSTVAPDVAVGTESDIFDSTAFLYSGDDLVQYGVEPGAIDERRVAILRGRVITGTGDPLSATVVSLLGHPELGHTIAREDGWFDMAVNGGGPITVRYWHAGHLPAQRQVSPPWRDWVHLPEVVLIPVDDHVTTIELGGSATMAHSGVVSDGDGTRTATLMFPSGTEAEMVFENGQTAPLNTADVRFTEYTVGERGEQAMPAELPLTTAYTYCAELSIDEATTAGAQSVRFNQPIYNYVDNFLDSPVGIVVPSGYYDATDGVWKPSANGRVIGVLGESDGLAILDVEGLGEAADDDALSALGISDEERAQLAARYTTGESFWRMPITHFSPHDFNFAYGPRRGSRFPAQRRRRYYPLGWRSCRENRSIVDLNTQSLGEAIPVAGTPYALRYNSDRAVGSQEYTLHLRLTDDAPPDPLLGVRLQISVAGRLINQDFGPAPNLTWDYAWDGRDAYDRLLNGRQPVLIRHGYVYEAVFLGDRESTDRWGPIFAQAGGRHSGLGAVMEGRSRIALWRETLEYLGNGHSAARGLGLWTFDVHHAYSRSERRIFTGAGDSYERDRIGSIVTTVAGACPRYSLRPDRPAYDACFAEPSDLAFAPDGSYYIADRGHHRILHVDPEGTITHFAGDRATSVIEGDSGFAGDGGPADGALFEYPQTVAVAPDGSVFVGDYGNQRIRRIDPDGIISTIAGGGAEPCRPCDGSAPTSVSISAGHAIGNHMSGDVVIGADGAVFFSDANVVQRIAPDLSTMTTYAGGADVPDCQPHLYACGEGGPAREAEFGGISSIALDRDGRLYLSESNRIRQVDVDGTVTTVAGLVEGWCDNCAGDGAVATEANFTNPSSVEIGPDDSLFFSAQVSGPEDPDYDHPRIFRVSSDGILTTYVGSGRRVDRDTNPQGQDDVPAHELDLVLPIWSLEFSPEGDGYFTEQRGIKAGRDFVDVIRRVGTATRAVGLGEDVVPAEDGRSLYVFDERGRHLRTEDTSGAHTLFEFEYDETGNLVAITDGALNRTVISRDTDGNPEAIIAPDGVTETAIELDGWGYLEQVVHPSGVTYDMTYSTAGLLETFTDGNGDVNEFTFEDGRLTRDEDGHGGFITLASSSDHDSHSVTTATAEGLETSIEFEYLAGERVQRTNTDPAGAELVAVSYASGDTTVRYPNGAVFSVSHQPDPQFQARPILDTLRMTTPGGLTYQENFSRAVVLEDPEDPLTLSSSHEELQINDSLFTFDYSAETGLRSVLSPEGVEVVTSFDSHGRTTRRDLDEDLAPIDYAYTDGQLSRISQGTQFWDYGYDANGRVASIEDASGAELVYTYDYANRRESIELPSTATYGYLLDGGGNIVEITMPSGAIHGFGYTARDGMSRYTPPGETDSFTTAYDLDHRVDLITLPSGRTKDFVYDDDSGLLAQIAYSEGTVTFDRGESPSHCCTGSGADLEVSWDSNTSAAFQTISYEHDANLVTGMAFSGAAQGSYGYTYDANFLLRSITLGVSTTTNIDYDRDGAVVTYGPFSFTREGPLRMTSRLSDGTMQIDYQYDANGRVETRTHHVNGVEVYVLDLTYDETERLAEVTERVAGESRVLTYRHDVDGMLEQVKVGDVETEWYAYDTNANRDLHQFNGGSEVSYVYDTRDRLESVGADTYEFNIDGFLTQRNGDVFTYSARGELLRVDLGSGESVTYLYDGFGRRVTRTDDSGTTEYLYGFPDNALHVSAVLEPDGTRTIPYYDEAGLLIGIKRGDDWYYVATDQLGTPRIVVNALGEVVETITWDSFGNVIDDSNDAFALPFGFAGGLPDTATGLVRFGFRDYEPATGRWTVLDPVLFDGNARNLYEYAGSNPIQLRDPSGLLCVGGGAFALLGGGWKVCANRDGVGVCGNVGTGAGGGISVDPFGGLPNNGLYVQAEAGVSAGALSAGREVKADVCGFSSSWKCAFGIIDICGRQVSQGNNDRNANVAGIMRNQLDDTREANRSGLGGLRAEAKLTIGLCQSFRW